MSKLNNTRSTERELRSSLIVGAMMCFVMHLTGCGGGGGESASTAQTPLPPPPPVAFVPSITLFAGALGGAGNTDGLPGRLNAPGSVAVDASNNIYIGDGGNCNIRKLSTSGLSVFMAGRSCHIYANDGTASNSTFTSYPYAQKIIADRVGTLYLVKTDAPISRMESDGKLTELPVTARGSARLAIDADGTIYEPDSTTGSIYKYDKSGNRTDFASGLRASLDLLSNSTLGLALGDDGTLYVADKVRQLVRKISRAGQVSTLAGTETRGSLDGVGTSAQFNNPLGIAVDRTGNVYIGDESNYTIRKITPDGVVSTLAGAAGLKGAADGKGAAARFMSVGEITVDKTGALIVADAGNNAIRRVSPDGVVTTIGGAMPIRGSDDGAPLTSRFNSPNGIARDSTGNIYLGDTGSFTIRKLSANGNTSTLAGKFGESGRQDGVGIGATFEFPQSTAVDQSGNVYVADYSRIRKISGAGDVSVFADAGSIPVYGSFGRPLGTRPRFLLSVAFDSKSQLYAVESIGANLSKVSTSGSFTPTSCGEGCTPLAVAGDAAGNIFVASRGAIRRIGVDGVASVLAGVESDVSRLTFDWKDGSGTAARFSSDLNALAVDTNGNIFVCDAGNHTIRKITPSGVVTTIAGKAGVAGTTLGPLPGLLNAPKGIVIDNAGNLYVTTEDAVVKITLS